MAYKIILDAGHGGDDPGAVYQNRNEKDDNLALTLAVGKILADNGVDVEYTRMDDTYQTPFEKATAGNQSGADYFISFHRNSSPSANQYSGIETLVYDKSGVKYEMAENINGAVSELGYRDLGVKERPGLVVLRRTQMPSLLIETGFINNDDDNELFDRQFDGIAQAIAYAILGTLDMETDTAGMNMGRRNTGMNTQQNDWPQDEMYDRRRPQRPRYEYRVQVGAFRNKEYADRLSYELEDQGYPAFVIEEDDLYKVQVGAYDCLANAVKMEQRLRMAGYSTWVRR